MVNKSERMIARESNEPERQLCELNGVRVSIDSIKASLGDQSARERMARTAWEEVRGQRMFAHQIPERRAWYAELLARREALDRAILQRVPEVAEILDRLGGLPPASDNYTS